MDNSDLVAAQFLSAPGASGLRWNSRSCAACPGLTVMYLERIAESTEKNYNDTAITVLIPGDLGAFNVSYRTED